MRLTLISLFSSQDNTGGIAVYDLDREMPLYAQLIDFRGLPGRICHIRGISSLGERLYAVSPFALFIFKPGIKRNGHPALILEKTVILREWLLGPGQQGNLHTVYASSKTNRIYISFNSQCAIDTFDPDGNFIERAYLWELSSECFPLPDLVSLHSGYRFGIVRHIFEDEIGLVLSASFVNDSSHGALLLANRGKFLLNTPFNLHGCIVHKGKAYLSDIESGSIHVLPWPIPENFTFTQAVRKLSPIVNESQWPKSVQNVRGMMVLHDRLISGICHFGKVEPTQVPPRLVEFDLVTGEQKAEHFLPSIPGLSGAQAYAIIDVPPWLTELVEAIKEPQFFLGDHHLTSNFRCGANVPIIHAASEPATSSPGQTKDEFSAKKNNLPTEESTTQISQSRTVLVLERVGLCFIRKSRTLFEWNKYLKQNRTSWALRDINFTLKEKEIVGIVGRNGSGKSTLSLVCAGVFKPDTGRISIQGKVQLLALGVGFKRELTGRENVFIGASLLGLSRKKIQRLLPEIEAFAELGEFIDEPVRTYSSGMRSKLGFAVSTVVEPEILILDEALSVGDKAFQDKAMARMRHMQQKAKSVLIVSHNPSQLKKFCTRVIWMEKGKLMMDGDPGNVIYSYENFCKNPEKWLQRHREQF